MIGEVKAIETDRQENEVRQKERDNERERQMIKTPRDKGRDR